MWLAAVLVVAVLALVGIAVVVVPFGGPESDVDVAVADRLDARVI